MFPSRTIKFFPSNNHVELIRIMAVWHRIGHEVVAKTAAEPPCRLRFYNWQLDLFFNFA
jgi:hypothetical protein